MKKVLRKIAPVLWLLGWVNKKNRALRQRRRDDDVLIESLQMRLAMQERRADRWERAAFEMAPRVGPRAMTVCLMQSQADEIAAFPEIRGRRNNRKAGT